MPPSAPAKRRYRIDPVTAHERAVLAARARNSPDSYITSLERVELSSAQKLRLAQLVLSFSASTAKRGDDRDGTTAGAR